MRTLTIIIALACLAATAHAQPLDIHSPMFGGQRLAWSPTAYEDGLRATYSVSEANYWGQGGGLNVDAEVQTHRVGVLYGDKGFQVRIEARVTWLYGGFLDGLIQAVHGGGGGENRSDFPQDALHVWDGSGTITTQARADFDSVVIGGLVQFEPWLTLQVDSRWPINSWAEAPNGAVTLQGTWRAEWFEFSLAVGASFFGLDDRLFGVLPMVDWGSHGVGSISLHANADVAFVFEVQWSSPLLVGDLGDYADWQMALAFGVRAKVGVTDLTLFVVDGGFGDSFDFTAMPDFAFGLSLTVR